MTKNQKGKMGWTKHKWQKNHLYFCYNKRTRLLAEMGVYVCDQAFNQSSVKEGEANRAAKALKSIFAGKLL